MKVVLAISSKASRRVLMSESRMDSRLLCATERTTLRTGNGLTGQVPLLTVVGIFEMGIVLDGFSPSGFESTIS